MQARVAKLETHFEHIRRDLNDVASDVRELRTEVREEFKAIRTEMREDFKEVHEEFKAVRTEIRDEFKEVRKEMREDLRIMFGGLVLVALGLATISAKGFGWL